MGIQHRGACTECWRTADLDYEYPRGLCSRCLLERKKEVTKMEPMSEDERIAYYEMQKLRAIVFGVVCIFLCLLSGCWIVNEWNLRSIQAVGGQVEKRYGPGADPAIRQMMPDLKVVPKEPEGKK